MLLFCCCHCCCFKWTREGVIGVVGHHLSALQNVHTDYKVHIISFDPLPKIEPPSEMCRHPKYIPQQKKNRSECEILMSGQKEDSIDGIVRTHLVLSLSLSFFLEPLTQVKFRELVRAGGLLAKQLLSTCISNAKHIKFVFHFHKILVFSGHVRRISKIPTRCCSSSFSIQR